MIKNIFLSLLLITSAPLFASQTTKNSFLPPTKIDKATSTFEWRGEKAGGSFHEGTIKLLKAESKMVKGKVVSGTFVIDMKSINCTDLAKNPDKQAQLVGHLKNKDFFDVTNNPTATLKLSKLAKGKAHGTLTIKGKSLPITIPYTQDRNTFSGKMTFDRTKYGITYKSKNFFKNLIGDKVINDDVVIGFKVNLI